MNKISIIGTGAYGLSIAIALLKKSDSVTMWVESEERVDFLNKNRKNSGILPNIKIPDNITFSNNLENIINDSNIIFIAVTAKNKKMASYTNFGLLCSCLKNEMQSWRDD